MLGDGFRARQYGTVLMLQGFPRSDAHGWMFGGIASYTSARYSHEAVDGEFDHLSTLIFAAIAGYRWFPYDSHFFLYPWARIGIALPVVGERDIVIGDHEMTSSLLDGVVTFHVGYEFDL